MSPSLARVAADALRGGRRHRYGDHRWAVGELHLPKGPGPYPTVIAVHGGSWRAGWGKPVMRPLCRDLARNGWAAWNVEYRRMGRGQGGGWPATFADVAAAIDHVAQLPAPLDLDRVVLLGHSAGGHLALWAAGRPGLPAGAPGAGPLVRPVAVVGQAPVADIERGGLAGSGGLVTALLGGTPADVPERYALANPMRCGAPGIPVLLVHGSQDRTVTVEHSRAYARMLRSAGAPVVLVEAEAGHRDHVDPRSAAWQAVRSRLDGLVTNDAVAALAHG